ncbi:MAG TPA: Sec-independent protein translocase subunit TatA [Pseudonocardia sp.]|jgi:sec-independent protein translocase protein TatA
MLGGWEWVILLVVVVLLFGAKRLPEMARSVGQSARVFKGEMKGMRDDEKHPEPDSAPPAERSPQAPQALPPGRPATTGGAPGDRPSGSRPAEPESGESGGAR